LAASIPLCGVSAGQRPQPDLCCARRSPGVGLPFTQPALPRVAEPEGAAERLALVVLVTALACNRVCRARERSTKRRCFRVTNLRLPSGHRWQSRSAGRGAGVRGAAIGRYDCQ
jgi:hypothetical protein